MVISQQASGAELFGNIQHDLEQVEKDVLADKPCVGELPRLDIIARFLASQKHKLERLDFGKKTSGQPSVNQCMEKITETVLKRIQDYHAKI